MGKFLGCGIVEKKFTSTQIDSLVLFEMDEYSILNTNDCPYELKLQSSFQRISYIIKR